MTKRKTQKTIDRKCPICRVDYSTPREKPAPTCGNPNCIREARALGMPFVAIKTTPAVTPKKPRKRTPGKASKIRS